MKIGYIYKIINPSGKVYIGQTINLKGRLNYYKSNNCQHQKILYNSIKKYGWVNHKFEIIEECVVDDGKALLNEREIYWIDNLGSFGDGGMNCNKGGNGNVGRVCSLETRIKIGLGNKGKIVSEEAKKKIGEFHNGKKYPRTDETKRKIGLSKKGHIVSDETRKKISNFNRGKIVSEETREKMRVKNLGRKLSKESREKISKNKKGKPWTEARRLAQKIKDK